MTKQVKSYRMHTKQEHLFVFVQINRARQQSELDLNKSKRSVGRSVLPGRASERSAPARARVARGAFV